MQCTYTGELANCTAFGTRKPSDPECGTFDKTLLQNVNVTKDKKKKNAVQTVPDQQRLKKHAG